MDAPDQVGDAPVSLDERLGGLAEFLPFFEAEGFRFGSWHSPPGMVPVYAFSEPAGQFMGAAYRLGWVLPEFDWPSWVGGPEAHRLIEDPGSVAAADAETLARLLTTHIRQERFCEGHLAAMYESGHLTLILRRICALHTRARVDGSPQGAGAMPHLGPGVFEVRSPQDADGLASRIRAAADAVPALLAAEWSDGLSLLRRLKFDAIGRHPLEDRPLNLVEQINQTFSCLASLRAARLLLEMHPEARGFRLVLGPHRGTDIESIAPGVVAAEVFAAVSPDSNSKLTLDAQRIAQHPAQHRYVFFHVPGYAEGPVRMRRPVEGVTVWAVEV